MTDRSAPNGCQHCGVAERDHFQRWTDAAGWHGYTLPTDAQRKDRMIARRADRIVAADITRHERRLAALLKREAATVQPRPALALIRTRLDGGTR